MHATVALDAYKLPEAESVALALDEICHPDDNYGWASEGVYCFFDLDSGSALYLGLAEDLASRFRQHNGLLPCPEDSCKREQIMLQFAAKEKLGFGVFLQSSLDQGTVRRNRRGRNFGGDGLGRSNAVYTEGRVIEAHRQCKGALPPWNHVGASLVGRKAAKPQDLPMIEALSGNVQSSLAARRTIRGLAADHGAMTHEMTLHTARFAFQWMLMSFEEAIAFALRCGGTVVPTEYIGSRAVL